MHKSHTAQQYGFYTFNEQSGLSKNSVLGINQVSNSEIYLGTNDGGLNILNGQEIRIFNENDGFIDNVVYDIINLKTNNQIITTNNGVNIIRNNKIVNCIYKDSLAMKRTFTALVEDDFIYLATGSGLARIINDTIFAFKTENKELDSSAVIHIRKDDNGSLWCATVGNSVFEIQKDKKVIKYNLGYELDYTFQTFQLNDSTVWFLTYYGVYQLNNGIVSRVTLNSESKLKIDTYYNYCIRDSKNNLWIATSNGVIKIDSNGNEILLTMKNGLAGNDAWKIFEDRENNIWIVFKSAGVSKLTTEAFYIYNKEDGILNEDVKTIFIDEEENRWLGTKDGVVKIEKDSIVYLKHGKDKVDEIKAIKKTRQGLLFLSASGVNLIKNKAYLNIRVEGDSRFDGTCIFESDNRIYFGSSVSGVAEFKNGKITYVNDSLGFEDRIGIYAINKTPDNQWWYATEKGLYRHDGKQLSIVNEKEGLVPSKTRSLILDVAGNLWVGNSKGVFYQKDGLFHPIYTEDSLHNHSIYALCFDLEGNLWTSKIDGIDKISIKNGEVLAIKHYDSKNGFGIGSLFNNSMALDSSNGHILVGTDKGLLEINPYLDFRNEVESKTMISDIQLFSQPTNWSDYSDSIDYDGFPVNLELAYNQNYFTFNYIGICHKFPEGVRYKIKLQGLDKDWVDRGNKRFVVYGNLKPGAYTFLLKSCNNEGLWNKEPVKFSFTIAPPFWQTWWFYSLCGLIVLGGIYSYLKIKKSNVLILEKNKQITQINEEVEQKNHEIMDSINYAKRIQDSMLPDSKLNYLIPSSFVFFQPKDIVSGDFYWLKRVERKFLIAAVDCTGHGVPGAFVSMIGFSGLNRAVNEYRLTSPDAILENLSSFVVDSFAKHESKSINDGMDASLCCIDRDSNVLEYAGANNSIYIIRNNEKPLLDLEGNFVKVKELGTLREIKATRRPIGKNDNPVPFAKKSIQLEKGDRVYLFTDGFPDQFGGDRGKKYMYKAFKRFLVSIQNTPIEKQGELLKKEFKIWTIGKVEQVDDICILGFEV